MTTILGIETSCDETAAAVIGGRFRSPVVNVVASQDELHERFHGVVPEIAARAHLERILTVIDETLRRAEITVDQLDAVAVANTPGLAGSLLVGLVAAKTLCAGRSTSRSWPSTICTRTSTLASWRRGGTCFPAWA
jgi:N6-L-threonylcarbamoyladenine synthase